MSGKDCSIEFRDASVVYNMYYDKTTTLKEYIVNLLHGRKYEAGGRDTLAALNGISLRIGHGERLGVIGLNGSGKSTFLKVIAGLLEPTGGKVSITGTVQPLIEVGAGFHPEFSGRENIYLNGAMLGFTKKQIRAKEGEIVEFTELGHFIDLPVKYYSSGMSMRLAFTIATMIEPEILVLDEMLSAGDIAFLSKAKDRIERLLSVAKILVIVSHDLDLIGSLARRTIVLHHGEVLFDGETSEAIKFYTDLVSDKIGQRREGEASEAVAAAPEQGVAVGLILPGATRVFGETDASREVRTGDRVTFSIEFRTAEPFEQFFVNLHVRNRTNTDVAHFRNDFAGLDFHDLGAGAYEATVTLDEIPFHADLYRYFFRLVGMRGGDQTIVDSPASEFAIGGDVKRDMLIKNSWNMRALGAIDDGTSRGLF
jgi:ABC-type polysaccharide/polyol phosphate transport system ATPase subunit